MCVNMCAEGLQRRREGVVVALCDGDFECLGRVELGHNRPLTILAQNLYVGGIDVERAVTTQQSVRSAQLLDRLHRPA